MNHVFATIMLANGTIAAYLALQGVFVLEQKYIVNRILTIFTIGSAIWSIGFGVLFLQSDVNIAYYCRSVGMIGVFAYLISAQLLIGYISEINKRMRWVLAAVAFLGVGVYFLTIMRDQIVFYMSEHGMTYHFNAGFANTTYTLYTLVVAADMFAVSIHMIRRAKTHRLQEFGKYFLIVEILIFLGMILDTIFPLIGLSAIPGSSITQFWGLCVLQYAVVRINHSRITIPNMSEFVYHSLSSPVLVYDMDYNVRIVNEAADAFFPETREKISHRNMSVTDLFEIDEEGIFDFEGIQRTYDAKCRGNDLYCSFSVNKIRDNYGDVIGYIIVVSDQTERMKAMQAMEEARIASENANNAKSAFLANMSHEIRTPMNAIMGFSELLLKEPLSKVAHDYSADIRGAAGNLLAIVNDILDITKIESGKVEIQNSEYDMAGMLWNVCEIIEPLARKKQLVFETDFGEDIPARVVGDEIRVRSILVNLLNNAVKYTKNGAVTFRIQVLRQTRDRVTLRYEIEDTGIGIRDEDQDILFEKFSQVDRKINSGIEGTGLGLAIVKGYLDMMGGTIHLESVYGEGSCFTVELEQQVADARVMGKIAFSNEERRAPEAGQELHIEGLDVLVVDDNAVNLKVIKKVLASYDIQAKAVMSGEEAIACCQKHHYPIVMMDQMMPNMDGIEAMRRIRLIDSYYAEGGEAKIIALTANAINGAREELLEAGFDEYLSKPIEFSHLEELLIRFTPETRVHLVERKPGQTETQGDTENAETMRNTGKGKTGEGQAPVAGDDQVQIDGIDREAGIARCGGDEAVYTEVLTMIVDSGTSQLREVQRFFQEGDYKNYVIQIHSMKSQLYNIGANELGDYAKLLEAAGKEENGEYIRGDLPVFSQEYKVMLGQVQQDLENRGVSFDAEASNDNLESVLESIGKLVKELDFAGVAKELRDTQSVFEDADQPELFRALQEMADEVDDDGIRRILEERGIGCE